MATTRGVLGQAPKVLFALSFADPVTGAATDPTGMPTVKVYLVLDDGTLDLKATLPLAKLQGITGWWGASQDISDTSTWPAGDYQLVAEAVVSAMNVTYTDTFEIDETALGAVGAFIAGAYCTEAQARGHATALESVTAYPTTMFTKAAVDAAAEINMDLSAIYAVPFAAPYPDTVILLASWLTASNVLATAQSQRGNMNERAAALRAMYDAAIADIYAGLIVIDALPATSTDTGSGILSSSLDYTPGLSIREDDSPLSRF